MRRTRPTTPTGGRHADHLWDCLLYRIETHFLKSSLMVDLRNATKSASFAFLTSGKKAYLGRAQIFSRWNSRYIFGSRIQSCLARGRRLRSALLHGLVNTIADFVPLTSSTRPHCLHVVSPAGRFMARGLQQSTEHHGMTFLHRFVRLRRCSP